jgi:hypothetical protein
MFELRLCAPHQWPQFVPGSTDPAVAAFQLPGNFTVYNGTMTGASYGADIINGGNITKQIILTGVTDPGGSAKDVLIVYGAHLGRQTDWGAKLGAHYYPGGSGTMTIAGNANITNPTIRINPDDVLAERQATIASTSSNVIVTEGALGTTTTRTIDVTLSQSSPTCTVTVGYQTADGTATSSGERRLHRDEWAADILPGNQKQIVVTIIGDNRNEADEDFFVNLSSADYAIVGSAGQAKVTVLNDDNITISIGMLQHSNQTAEPRRSIP